MKKTTLTVLFLALAGCESPVDESFSPSTVQGVASDSLIRDGLVRITPVNSGKTLASTRTDSQGRYSLTNFQAPKGHYRLILEGGSYIEEASGQRVDLAAGQHLESLVYHEPGRPVTAMITPETTMASALARCYVKRDGMLLSNADRNASAQLASMYDVNINTTEPIIITQAVPLGSVSSTGLKYGFIQAGRSELTQWINEENGHQGHDVYTSVDFSELTYRDIKDDCTLDGMALEGDRATQLSLGVIDVDANTYRTELSRGIFRAARADYNKTGYTVEDVLPLAQQISNNTESVYGGLAPQAVDSTGPRVIWGANPQHVYSRRNELVTQISDDIGVDWSEFYINGTLQASSSNEGDITWSFDTTDFTDGPVTLRIDTRDSIGNLTSSELEVVFDNTGPNIQVESTGYSNSYNYRIFGTVEDSYSPLSFLKIDSRDVVVSNGEWYRDIALNGEVTQIELIGVDAMGEQTQLVHEVLVDRGIPVIDVTGSLVRFRDPSTEEIRYRSLTNSLNYNQQFIIDPDNLSLGHIGLGTEALDAANLPYISLTTEDELTPYFTSAEDLDVRYTVRALGDKLVDNQPVPHNGTQYVLPFTIEYLSTRVLSLASDDRIELTVTVTDLAGNAVDYTYSSYLYLDLSKVEFLSLGLDANTLSAYQFNDGRAGLLNECIIVEGSCRIAFASVEEDIYATVPTVRYREPYNERIISTLSDLHLTVPFRNESISVALSPATMLHSGYFEAALANGAEGFMAAYNEATAQMIEAYGFNPVTTPIATVLSGTELSDSIKHRLFVEAVSLAAYQEFGYFTPEVNSITTAQAAFLDMRDGVMDGMNESAPTTLDGAEYSYTAFRDGFGKEMVNIAWRKAPDLVEQTAAYAQTFYTPALPTIDVELTEGPIAGEIRIDPQFTAETAYSTELVVDGNSIQTGAPWTIETSDYTDGSQNITVQITDLYGQTEQKIFPVTFDNSGPEVSVTSSLFATSTNVDLVIEASDPTDPITHTINGSIYLANNGVVTVPMPLEGEVTLVELAVMDGLENTTNLVVPVMKLPAEPVPVSGVHTLYDATGSEVVFRAFINGSEVANRGTQGQLVLDASLLEPGLVDVVVRAEGATGQGSVHSGIYPVIVDHSQPVISPVNSRYTQSDSTNLRVVVSDDQGALSRLEINGSAYSPFNMNFLATLATPNNSNSVSIMAEDEAGNEAVSNITVYRVAAIAGTPTGVSSIQVLDGALNPSDATLVIDGSAVSTSLLQSDGTLDTSGLAPGAHSYSIRLPKADEGMLDLKGNFEVLAP